MFNIERKRYTWFLGHCLFPPPFLCEKVIAIHCYDFCATCICTLLCGTACRCSIIIGWRSLFRYIVCQSLMLVVTRLLPLISFVSVNTVDASVAPGSSEVRLIVGAIGFLLNDIQSPTSSSALHPLKEKRHQHFHFWMTLRYQLFQGAPLLQKAFSHTEQGLFRNGKLVTSSTSNWNSSATNREPSYWCHLSSKRAFDCHLYLVFWQEERLVSSGGYSSRIHRWRGYRTLDHVIKYQFFIAFWIK